MLTFCSEYTIENSWFEYNLRLNRRQSSSDKKHFLRWSLVLFFLFRCPLLFCRISTIFFINRHTRTLYSTPVSEMFFTFLRENLFEKNFSRWMSVKQLVKRGRCKLPAPIKGWNFGAKLAHLCGFWLDISVFSHMKKHRARFWLDTTFFSRVKKHRSLIWLAGTHLCMKIYDIAFWCVFLSIYLSGFAKTWLQKSLIYLLKSLGAGFWFFS